MGKPLLIRECDIHWESWRKNRRDLKSNSWNMITIGKVKAHELRTKGKGELLTQLKELKEELSTVSLADIERIWNQTSLHRWLLVHLTSFVNHSFVSHKWLVAPQPSFLKLDPSENQLPEFWPSTISYLNRRYSVFSHKRHRHQRVTERVNNFTSISWERRSPEPNLSQLSSDQRPRERSDVA